MFFFASSGWILVKSEGSGVSFKILAHSGTFSPRLAQTGVFCLKFWLVNQFSVQAGLTKQNFNTSMKQLYFIITSSQHQQEDRMKHLH
jgi:hypothetical protein